MLKLETKNKLNIFYLILAIIFTIITYFYLILSYYPYRLDVKKRYILDSDVIQKIYFNDLDKNGESERFELHYLKDIKRNMLLCYNSDDILMEQFYLDGAVRKEWIHFNDWDNDEINDLIIFHVNNDSLYCDVIDVLGRKYLVKNLFVSIKDKRNNSKEWYFDSLPIFDKEKKLMYLSVSTGYGIYPRSLFIIDQKKLKVLKRFDSTAPVEQAYLSDLNGNKNNEFIVLTKAAGNDFIKKGYHDFNSWLFLFDDTLGFYRIPKSINRYPGSSFLYKLYDASENFLIFTNEINLPKVNAQLLKHDNNFNIIKSLSISGSILKPVIDTNSQKIITSTREGLFTIYDYNFQITEQKQIHFSEPNIVKKISIADIDNDDKLEIITFIDGEIRIYDQQLNLLTARKSDYQLKEIDDNQLITNYKSAHGNVLVVPSQTSVWVYALVNNLLISNLFLLLPIVLVIYFLSILFTGKILAFIAGYINVFNYFVKVSDQGMMLLTNSGKIKKINQSFIRLLLLEETNYIDKHFQKVLAKNEEVASQISNSIEFIQDSEKELTFRKGDVYFNGKIKVKIFKSFFNYPYAYLVEVIDYSVSLLEDRYRIWSRTSQKIAHDIKTPLSTILLNLKSLQYRIDKEELINKDVYNEDLTIIQNELDRIKNLTRNFLKFTNSEKPNFVNVVVSEIIYKSIEQFESYFDNKIELKIDIRDDCIVSADENQLEQLFHILIENAIDAINKEGYVRITIEDMNDLAYDQNKCLIEISDSGCGIPKEVIYKIFEPYFTTKDDGTGMGLAIGKKIVDDHKGSIEFYSHNNLGTTVKLILPLVKL